MSSALLVSSDLKNAAEERRQVQDEILAISDRERQRIGRDLHDSLGQRLTGVALLLAVLKRSLENQDRPEAKSAAEIGVQMKAAVTEARNISHGLMPLSLQDGGIVAGTFPRWLGANVNGIWRRS